MKKFNAILLLLIILSTNAHGINKKDSTIWQNLRNAIEVGADQFVNHELDQFTRFTVFVIKIITIEKNKGVFSISYILNDPSFENVNASNYFTVDDRLVLIRTDSLENFFTKRSGFPLMNDSIKKKAYHILSGPNNFITAQPPPVMVFSYKRKKVTGKYFKAQWQAEDIYMYYNNER
ncbi:hypothetical protein [Sunxiuqinia indica]|uniref:hypothetical protein n=1 Tax=Sunxiuqinia indica TaxID=2692584 RepID=UPI00135A6A23|nr:hypothetical protein [Sunxiuqinia indica]